MLGARESSGWRFCVSVTAAWLSLITPADASITLVENSGWKFSVHGYIQQDSFFDTTQSFSEGIGNVPVQRTDTAQGQNPRTQFSIRTSRIGFAVAAPPKGDWKTNGFIEFDLNGFNPAPASTNSNTEFGFFNSPTFRLRHGVVKAENKSWLIHAGQTWSLFGWQPFYMPSAVNFNVLAGVPIARNAQFRLTNTMEIGKNLALSAAFAIARPTQRDSNYPTLEGGLRIFLKSLTGGFTQPNADHKTDPLSLGISGLLRQFKVPTVGGGLADRADYESSGFSVSTFVPIIFSHNGKTVSNTLSVGGSYTACKGCGDQFPGWTGNMANPLSNAAVGSVARTLISAGRPINLDGGIGDFNQNSQFTLMNSQGTVFHLQFHLPSAWKTWFNVGYGKLTSDNMATLIDGTGRTSSGGIPIVSQESYFANILHDITTQIRISLEYLQVATTYADNMLPANNRLQLSALFLF